MTVEELIALGNARVADILAVKKLAMHCLGRDAAALISGNRDTVSNADADRFETLLSRLEKGEPVHRIIGAREFHGLEFKLGAETLEPRDDTESLIECVLQQIPDRSAELRFVDLGTGTGAIAFSLLSELPNARAVMTDISAEALKVASENAESLGFADRVKTRLGSWLEPVEGKFDFIVSNPPYIETATLDGLAPEVREFDPVTALDGGADGLSAYRVIFNSAAAPLNPSGFLAVEIGFDQLSAVTDLAKQSGWSRTCFSKDLAGNDRAIVFRP